MTDLLQEDNGIVAIHSVCSRMRAIWRPTPNHDIGIDGQIELLEDDGCTSTGNIISVQSKSGPSYFTHQDDHCVFFYPTERQKRYWRVLKLPIILVLHNPDTSETYYTRVKPQLWNKGPIIVQKEDKFRPECRAKLLATANEDSAIFDPHSTLEKFLQIECLRDSTKHITGIDFLLACVNRHQAFFELRMCRVTTLFEMLSETNGYHIGQLDYDFILRNVITIHSTGITESFLEDFENAWFSMSIVPDISVPLSPSGHEVLELFWNCPEKYLALEPYLHLGYADAKQLAMAISDLAQDESDRLDASDKMTIEPK